MQRSHCLWVLLVWSVSFATLGLGVGGCAASPELARLGEHVIEAGEGSWWVRVEWSEGVPWRRVTYRNSRIPWLGEVQRVFRVRPYAFAWEQEIVNGSCSHDLAGCVGEDAFALGEHRVILSFRQVRADLRLSEAVYCSYWVPAAAQSRLPWALGEDGVCVRAWVSHDPTPRGFVWDPQAVCFFNAGPSTRVSIEVETLFLNGRPVPLAYVRPLLRGTFRKVGRVREEGVE